VVQSNIKVRPNNVGRNCVDSIHLAHDSVMLWDFVHMVIKVRVS